ncbi:MAG: hypothetical protein ACIAQZ_10070 [Sedimentisphaeraceae bacterium JB056]
MTLQINRFRFKGCNNIKDIPDLSLQDNGLIICDQVAPYDISIIDVVYRLLSGDHDALKDIIFGHLSTNQQVQKVELVTSINEQEYAISPDIPIHLQPEEIRKATNFFKKNNQVLKLFSLQEFSKAPASKRYEFISQFLNLTTYIDFEKRLEILTAPTDKLLARISSQVNKKNKLLSQILANEGFNSNNECVDIVNAMLAKSNIDRISSLEDLPDAAGKITEVIENWTNSPEYKTANELKVDIDNIVDHENLFDLWVEYSDTWSSLRYKELESKGLFFEDVLEKGLEWITSDNLVECPLCGSDISIDKLKLDIKKRIESNKEFISLRDDFAKKADKFYTEIKKYIVQLTVINEKCKTINIQNPLAHITDELQESCSLLNSEDPEKVFIPLLNDFHKDTFKHGLEILKQDIERKFEELAGNEELAQLKSTREEILKIQNISRDILGLQKNRNELLKQKSTDSRINDIAVKARNNVVESFVKSVAPIADRLIKEVFEPSENNGRKNKNQWQYDPHSSITLHCIGINTDQSVLPAYYSDQILPVAGLCIFLAVRKIEAYTECRFPVLLIDKAIDCINEEYIQDVTKMVLNEFNKDQFFISTSNLEILKALTAAKAQTNTKIAVKFDSLALYSEYRKMG